MTSRIRVLGGIRQVLVSGELSHKIHMKHLLMPKEDLYFPAPEVDHITAMGTPNCQTFIELKGDFVLYVSGYVPSLDMWRFLIVSKNEVPF